MVVLESKPPFPLPQGVSRVVGYGANRMPSRVAASLLESLALATGTSMQRKMRAMNTIMIVHGLKEYEDTVYRYFRLVRWSANYLIVLIG